MPVRNVPEPTDEHATLVAAMYRQALKGWYVGDEASLRDFGAFHSTPSRTNPGEVWTAMILSRDRMHHSVGWWRNAEYEYCWHLSLSARPARESRLAAGGVKVPVPYADLAEAEQAYWGRLFFQEHANKVWNEPGGTDPRLSPAEARRNRHIVHLRLFLDPETFQPFVPTGEVYHLTRWVPGLTPDKVDR